MAVTRPGKALRCAGCGKTGAEKTGANNWKMCDSCGTAWCTSCFKGSTSCTDHSPWGKWLTGSGSFGTMTFK